MHDQKTNELSLSMLEEALAKIVGENTTIFQDIVRAFQSDNKLDMYLAIEAFNSLPTEKKRRIAEQVKNIAINYKNHNK